MNKKVTILLPVLLFLSVLFTAQAQVAIKDVAIDKLLDEVRVTIACSGTPNISSFVSQEPPAVIVDVMDGVSQVAQERISSSYYPVTAVTVKPSEATSGVRVTVLLRQLVRHRITNENGVITVSLGTQPLPPPPAPEPEDQFSGKPPLTLLVQDAEVTSVLRMLARQFDLNLMITQDVKSVVSVRLNEVPLRAGLEALVKAAGCNIVEDRSGVLIVKPVKKEMYGEVQTRVFNLDYIEAEDVLKVIKKALSPVGEATVGYRRVGTKGGAAERSAVLVVSDVPEALDEVAKIIADLDRPVPQIAIEAKFVETTHSAEDRWGIDWTPVASFGTELPKIGEEVAIPVIVKEMLFGKISFNRFSAA
ncbi:MAG: secretin N-terminal domain-containing protein, partial [candidate division WOR-3 bacterium]